MSQATITGGSADSVEQVMRDELARCDAATSAVGPVLRHLVANEDPILFSDAVIARIRGMMGDLADQLLNALEDRTSIKDRAARHESLSQKLAGDAVVLAHLHAMALEGRLTERLQTRGGVDEVLSPLLEELSASQDQELAALAHELAAAQTRFMQHYRQMKAALEELPVPVFLAAVAALRAEAGPEVGEVEQQLRERYGASPNRLGLLEELVGLVPEAKGLLSLEEVGLATFASALAKAAHQERDTAILSLAEMQASRLVLALRSAGLAPRAVEQQFYALHPDLSFPENFEALSPQRAAALLKGEGAS